MICSFRGNAPFCVSVCIYVVGVRVFPLKILHRIVLSCTYFTVSISKDYYLFFFLSKH